MIYSFINQIVKSWFPRSRVKLQVRTAVYITFAFIIGFSSPAHALDEKFYSSNNILFYSPDAKAADTETSCLQGGGGLDDFLKALAKQESGGDPTAANKSSSARGKYQYLTTTWQSRESLYTEVKKYDTADLAPESVQDAVAYIEYAQKWKQFDGSIFKLAISHFYPAANEDESLLDVHQGPASNPTPREYGDAVVAKVESGYGSEIPLKYTEAPGFNEALTKAVGSTTDFTGTVSSNASACASVGGSGLTLDQAKKFVMNYGANKNGDSAKFAGALWPFCQGGGANCVTFSYFFNHKFTDLPASPGDGNGEDIVGSLRSKGAKTGTTPKLYATFSWDNDTYGHTGIVLGISGDQVIVGHASCGSGSPGAGDGTTLGKGAAIVRSGKANDKNVWLGQIPKEFAYPDSVKTSEIQKYISN